MATIEITTKIGCKNNCSYCPQDRLVHAYTERSDIYSLNFSTFKTCIEKIPKEVGVNFSGFCEPWLNPECTRMLLFAHERGHKISLFTTLVGMSLTDIDSMKNIRFKEFLVHLPSNNELEKINVDDNYLSVLDKISKGGISVEYLNYGRDLDRRVKALFEKNGIIGEWGGKLSTRAGNVKGKPAPLKRTGNLRCERSLRNNVLLPNGDVILCCMDYGLQHVLGNLLTSDYKAVFSSPEYERIVKGLRDESSEILCRYCDKYAYSGINYGPHIKTLKKIFKGLFPGVYSKIKKKRNERLVRN